MTKEEEILNKHVGLYFSSHHDKSKWNGEGENGGVEWHTDKAIAADIYKAMDEHAKQQAILFMQWNSHMYTEGIDRQAGKWFNHKGECVASSTEELYGQFIASQNNPESFYYTGNHTIEQQTKDK